MKFTIETKKFITTINTIASIFQKSSMYIAKGHEILVTATKDNTLTIETSHLGMYIKATLPAEIAEKGAFLVNSKYILGLRLLNKLVSFSYKNKENKENKVNFSCGKFKGFIYSSQSPERIKDQIPSDIKTNIHLPIEIFKQGLKLVTFTPNKNTPILPLNIITVDNNLCLISYDRFSATYFNTPSEIQENIDIILPANFTEAVFDKLDGAVQLGIKDNKIKISNDEYDIYYPTKQKFQRFDVVHYYKKLIEQKVSLSFKCNAAAWLESLKTASSLAAGLELKDNRVTITIDPDAKKALIDLSISIGEASIEFELLEIAETEKTCVQISSLIFNSFLSKIKDKDINVRLFTQNNFKRILIEVDNIRYLLPLAQEI